MLIAVSAYAADTDSRYADEYLLNEPIYPSDIMLYGIEEGDLTYTDEQGVIYKIVNNKTYLPMYVPNFSTKEETLAFILGYYDGDGSISISKDNQYLRFRICAHRDEILKSIAQKLKNLYNIDFSLSCDKRGLYELSISTHYSKQIFEDMYNLNSLRLNRKYQKFLEYTSHETTTSLIEG